MVLRSRWPLQEVTDQLVEQGGLAVRQLVPYGPPPTVKRYLPKSQGIKKLTGERKAWNQIVRNTRLAELLHREVRSRSPPDHHQITTRSPESVPDLTCCQDLSLTVPTFAQMCASRPRILLVNDAGWKPILEDPQFTNDLSETKIIYLKAYDSYIDRQTGHMNRDRFGVLAKRAKRFMGERDDTDAVAVQTHLQALIDQL